MTSRIYRHPGLDHPRKVELTMKLLSAVAALALAGMAVGARAQEAEFPDNAAVVRAEVAAKRAAGACEGELKAGKSGPACTRYHKAVLDALALEHRRFAWCNVRMSETSTFRVAPSCLAGQADMRIDALMGMERKVSPKTWKAFDDQMAKFSN
jgi:hypothetical protein